ncbi:hypothetical protein NTGZN8_80010 [Candidatus Nitrotoga fabula]|uniref:Uncharacterized protein n=1 Tax=Candidatus Nitrotoga fabula TaxID=2182327 RepID=A0A916FAG8_9PROT|nr:hypothetical protein NTGZN8_80010 [Candidatus Nitrotoga fabula]
MQHLTGLTIIHDTAITNTFT